MEWGYVRKAKDSDVLDQIRVTPNKQHSIFQEKTVKIVKAELNGFGETTWNLEKGHVQFKIPEGMNGEELSDWAENKASYLIAFLELGEVDFLAVKEDNDDYGDNKTLAELIASAWFEWTQSLEHPTYDTDDE
jgi:hypothetical protein